MHEIEPFYGWRDLYIAEEDPKSPFYGRQYSEFEYSNSIYNYMIHPQWDEIGSDTLVLKILFVDYAAGQAIIELLGEWNDCISNDVMYLKRDVLDGLIDEGINKFVFIVENILNFHFDIDDYYAELYEDVEDGWIVVLNPQEHVYQELIHYHLDNYMMMGGPFNSFNWRIFSPSELFSKIEFVFSRQISFNNDSFD